MGNLRLTSILLFTVTVVEIQAKDVNLVIGLAGSGKTSIVNSLCKKAENINIPKPDMAAGTLQAEEVACGDQVLVDTVGLMHLTEGISAEDALFEGLKELLSYVNGHSIGHVYIVTNSNYIRDSARVLEQVDLLKSVMNPLIPWTGMVNCWHGVCPSTLPEAERPEFLTVLKGKVDTMVEVDSPHKKPVPSSLFQSPKTYYSANLPTDWQAWIKKYRTSDLRDQMQAKAKDQCNAYCDAIKSAKAAKFTCSVAACQNADCNSLPGCPPPQCPNFPCADEGSCHRHRHVKYKCGFLNLETCHDDHHWNDEGCLNSVRDCHRRRGESCNNHNNARNQCLTNRQNNCNALTQAENTCNSSRATNCEQLRVQHDKANQEVMKAQVPLYARCVAVFGYEKL